MSAAAAQGFDQEKVEFRLRLVKISDYVCFLITDGSSLLL